MCYPNNYWGVQMKERATILEMAARFVCNLFIARLLNR